MILAIPNSLTLGITNMDELKELTIEQLRMLKFQLIGELQLLQTKCRQIDRVIKEKLKEQK